MHEPVDARSSAWRPGAGDGRDHPELCRAGRTQLTRRGARTPGETDSLVRGIAFGAGATFVVTVLGIPANYGCTALLTHLLGSAGYGVYAYVLTFAGVLGLLATLGQNVAISRYLPASIEARDGRRARGVVAVGLVSTVGVGTIGGAVLAGAGLVVRDPTLARALVRAFWLVPALALLELLLGTLRALDRAGVAVAPKLLLRHVAILLVTAGLLVTGTRATPLQLLWLHGAVVAGLLVWQRRMVRHELDARVGPGAPLWRSEAARWLRGSLPMLLSTASAQVIANADVLVLGLWRSPREVGVYYVASRVAFLTVLVTSSVNISAAPSITRSHLAGDHGRLQRIISFTTHVGFWPACVMGLAAFAFGARLLALFGADFAAGADVLIVLIAGQLVNAATGVVGTLLNMIGLDRAMARVLVVGAAADVVGLFVAVPRWGLLGAAYVTGATVAAANIVLAVIAWRVVRVNVSVFRWPARA